MLDFSWFCSLSLPLSLTFYLLLSLILVSVGFAVTILGLIIFKVYKWKQSRDLYRGPVSSLYRTPGPSLHADAVRGGLLPPHLYHQVYLTTDSRRSDPLLKKPGVASPLASRQNTLRSCDPVFYRQVLGAESSPPGQVSVSRSSAMILMFFASCSVFRKVWSRFFSDENVFLSNGAFTFSPGSS